LYLIFHSPLIKRWRCTLCQDTLNIRLHANILLKKDIKAYFVSGYSEKRIIEYILMVLYCQNGDSEHYRECLNSEIVRYYMDITII
jgi:hypothetical protein